MLEITANKHNRGRKGKIFTPHGDILFPSFMPDATYGTVHNLTFADLKATGIQELVTTTLHIEQKLGSQYLQQFGGIHKFMGWDRPVLTDSGGYQVFSLIYRNPNKVNKITEAGCSFIDYTTGNYNFLTPEISQAIQFGIGSDVRLALDIPIPEDASLSLIKESVERNTRWAKRSKDMFLKLHDLTEADFNNPNIDRPLLAAIVQGANNFEYRKLSAEQLIEIGFDMYNFGGMPLHKEKTWIYDGPSGFFHDLIAYVASLLPENKIRYGMGLGTPDDLLFASSMGWDIFDSVLPTRNARHGYLYVHPGQGDRQYQDYDVLHVKNEQNKFKDEPIDAHCQCEACRTVSRAYLRHLIKIQNGTGLRLATIHNLTFYAELMQKIRSQK